MRVHRGQFELKLRILTVFTGVINQQATWNYSSTVKTIQETVKTASGEVAQKSSKVYRKFPFGERLISHTLDPDGANLQTVYTYYELIRSSGSYGRVKTVSFPNGGWVAYQYDDDGRVTTET